MDRYFVTGGGTGGHIYPAIAVADNLDGEIFYVGNPKNLEYNIVSQKNYTFLPVNITAMPRCKNLKLLFWLFKLGFAVLRSMTYLLKYKPCAVFGTGGYVSAPCLIAAKILHVPFFMHDCDAKPGLVTIKLSPYAKGVSVAFESACDYIKNENCNVNGNPIRSEFKTLTKEAARKNLGLEDKLTVCIMGGSQGAKSINDEACKILKILSDKGLQVIFQTGKKNFDDVKEKLSKEYPHYESDKNLIVKPYFDDMVTVLKASDIAVSRAGSLSISELCASSVAAIYVPYPYAAADHQRKNARFMEEKGAGIYLEDDEVGKLSGLIFELVENPQKLQSLQNAALACAKYNAVFNIIKQIKEFVY